MLHTKNRLLTAELCRHSVPHYKAVRTQTPTLTFHPGSLPLGDDPWQRHSSDSENEIDDCEEARHPDS